MDLVYHKHYVICGIRIVREFFATIVLPSQKETYAKSNRSNLFTEF